MDDPFGHALPQFLCQVVHVTPLMSARFAGEPVAGGLSTDCELVAESVLHGVGTRAGVRRLIHDVVARP